MKEDLKNAWEINESLLQSYRTTFIISQSVFVVLGGLLLNNTIQNSLMLLLAIIILFIIWYFWFSAVRARALVVDYYKIQVMFDFSNQVELCKNVDEYVNNLTKRRAMNRVAGIKSNWRDTRIKFDLLLPVIYTIVWILFVIYKFI